MLVRNVGFSPNYTALQSGSDRRENDKSKIFIYLFNDAVSDALCSRDLGKSRNISVSTVDTEAEIQPRTDL